MSFRLATNDLYRAAASRPRPYPANDDLPIAIIVLLQLAGVAKSLVRIRSLTSHPRIVPCVRRAAIPPMRTFPRLIPIGDPLLAKTFVFQVTRTRATRRSAPRESGPAGYIDVAEGFPRDRVPLVPSSIAADIHHH